MESKMLAIYDFLMTIVEKSNYDYTVDHLSAGQMETLRSVWSDADCVKVFVTVDRIHTYLEQNGYWFQGGWRRATLSEYMLNRFRHAYPSVKMTLAKVNEYLASLDDLRELDDSHLALLYKFNLNK